MTRRRNGITEGMVGVLEAALRELVREADRNGCCMSGCRLRNNVGCELDELDWFDDEDGGVGGRCDWGRLASRNSRARFSFCLRTALSPLGAFGLGGLLAWSS